LATFSEMAEKEEEKSRSRASSSRRRESSPDSSPSSIESKKANKKKRKGKQGRSKKEQKRNHAKTCDETSVVSTAISSFRERVDSNVLAHVIPSFDPKCDHVVDWLRMIDEHASSYNWDDHVVKYQALNKLRGTAEKWYQNYTRKEAGWAQFSWSMWKSILATTFQSTRDTYGIFMSIANHKPLEGESLYSFFFDHLAKIDQLKCDFTHADKVSLIVGAINDETIMAAVKPANMTDINILGSYLRDRTFSGRHFSGNEAEETRNFNYQAKPRQEQQRCW
jgi:hypothetical protein